MKKYFLSGLLAIASIAAFAQQPIKDTVKERNSLIELRAKLTQETKGLQEDLRRQQALFDSASRKLATDSASMDKKNIQRLRRMMDKQTSDINASKAQLKQASDLVQELDDQIKKLQSH